MILKLILLPLLFTPSLGVNWSSDQTVKIELDGYEQEVASCVKSGFQARYRYEAQICSRRLSWVDRCANVYTEINRMELDAISETYRVVSDRLYDKDPPKVLNEADFSRAVQQLSLVEKLPLLRLDGRWQDRHRPYVSVRVRADCKGEYIETLARVYNVLTLGLISNPGYDSGWHSFDLDTTKR